MTTGVAVVSGAASSATAVLIGRSKKSVVRAPTSSVLKIPSASAACSRKLRCRTIICCEVALRSEAISTEEEIEDEEVKRNMEKVGSKVRVKAPLKVYHVAKLPDLEITPDMVGVIKQYVGFWKGKRISPNYPFKVEFVIQGQGRAGGPLKFALHLKEDEFQIIP